MLKLDISWQTKKYNWWWNLYPNISYVNIMATFNKAPPVHLKKRMKTFSSQVMLT